MDFEITHRPSYAQLNVSLDAGEAIRAEAGAMVSHTGGIEIETKAEGGLLKSLTRSVFGGESFFMNTFSATAPSNLHLAPTLSGDINAHELTDESLYVQSTSFLASELDVSVDTEFGGSKTFFGGEGLFLLKVSGTGQAFTASYGAINELTIDAGESIIVDTGHVVAFEESLSFDVNRVGGLKSTLFSGEGLVCEFSGDGTVWTQTRSPDAFLSWLIPQLPSQNSQQ